MDRYQVILVQNDYYIALLSDFSYVRFLAEETSLGSRRSDFLLLVAAVTRT